MLQEHHSEQTQLVDELRKERTERTIFEETIVNLKAKNSALEVESRNLRRFKEKIPEICQQLERLQNLQRYVGAMS